MTASARVTGVLSLALVLNLAGLMAFPAVLPELMAEWNLSESQAGSIGGIYFAGYAAAVPLLSGLTDRIDGRRIHAAACLVGAVASFGFVWWADGFWPALLLRFASGVGLAGVHMPGLKLLADRTDGATQARSSAFYTSSYALGSGASFVIAGILAARFGWEAAFVAGGIGPLCAVPLLALVGPPRRTPAEPAAATLDFRPVLRNRDVVSYILCYAGNTWEVFAIRTWFVAFAAFSQHGAGGFGADWNPALLSGLSALVSVPASILIAEAGVRAGRTRAILATTLASVAVCAAIALCADAAFPLVLALLFLHGVTSFGDTGAITGGVVAASDPRQRGVSLAVYAFSGFTTGFLGPLAVGVVLELAGGVGSAVAWGAAFLVMALGSAVGAAAVAIRRPASR